MAEKTYIVDNPIGAELANRVNGSLEASRKTGQREALILLVRYLGGSAIDHTQAKDKVTSKSPVPVSFTPTQYTVGYLPYPGLDEEVLTRIASGLSRTEETESKAVLYIPSDENYKPILEVTNPEEVL